MLLLRCGPKRFGKCCVSAAGSRVNTLRSSIVGEKAGATVTGPRGRAPEFVALSVIVIVTGDPLGIRAAQRATHEVETAAK